MLKLDYSLCVLWHFFPIFPCVYLGSNTIMFWHCSFVILSVLTPVKDYSGVHRPYVDTSNICDSIRSRKGRINTKSGSVFNFQTLCWRGWCTGTWAEILAIILHRQHRVTYLTHHYRNIEILIDLQLFGQATKTFGHVFVTCNSGKRHVLVTTLVILECCLCQVHQLAAGFGRIVGTCMLGIVSLKLTFFSGGTY